MIIIHILKMLNKNKYNVNNKKIEIIIDTLMIINLMKIFILALKIKGKFLRIL